ncbi:MAG: hypothetical protein JO034_06105 [Singulisphaera sp.]|nr:hypothetical protein [Singulisphaera sp.]
MSADPRPSGTTTSQRSTRRRTAEPANCAVTAAKLQPARSQAHEDARPEGASFGNASNRLRPRTLGYSRRWTSSISSRRRCNSAALAQDEGAAHRLAVPCGRSTTPLSCGRRGGSQSTATSRPISHHARSVGRSPAEPRGAPLSTRSRSGRPQRVNACRN